MSTERYFACTKHCPLTCKMSTSLEIHFFPLKKFSRQNILQSPFPKARKTKTNWQLCPRLSLQLARWCYAPHSFSQAKFLAPILNVWPSFKTTSKNPSTNVNVKLNECFIYPKVHIGGHFHMRALGSVNSKLRQNFFQELSYQQNYLPQRTINNCHNQILEIIQNNAWRSLQSWFVTRAGKNKTDPFISIEFWAIGPMWLQYKTEYPDWKLWLI